MHVTHGPQPNSAGLFVLALTLAFCAPARAPEAPAPRAPATPMSAEALLAELNPRGGAAIVQAWHGDDPEELAAFYTDDAVLVVDAETVYRGKAAIREGFLRPWAPSIRSLTPTIEHVVGGTEEMTLIGTYTAEVSPPNGPAYEAQGTFGNTWVRQPDGAWKIRASVSSTPSAAAAEEQTIREFGARFRDAYSRGDADAVAALFADDAVWATNTGEILRGREQIHSALGRYVQVPQQVIRGEDLKGDLEGGFAYSVSAYENRVMPPGADPILVSGYGLAVFRQQSDGEWRIEALVVNRDPNAPR